MKNLNLVLFHDLDGSITSLSLDFPVFKKDYLLDNLDYIKEANGCLFVRLFDDCGNLLGTSEK